ncbi:MAG: phage holin family protein [Sporichthyaceae bacterium]
MAQSLTKDAPAPAEPSLGELVATATKAASELMRAEIELAKAELTAEAKKAAIGGGMFGGAAFFGLFAFLLLSFAAAYGVAASPLPTWAGFLVVGGVYLLFAAIMALVGLKAVKKMGPPEATVRTAKETVSELKGLKERRRLKEAEKAARAEAAVAAAAAAAK